MYIIENKKIGNAKIKELYKRLVPTSFEELSIKKMNKNPKVYILNL